MKRVNPRSSGCAVLIAFASIGACLHASETMAVPSEPVVASSAAPSNVTRSANRALRKSVYVAFSKDKSIDAGNIGVSAKNGVVTLSGTVADAAQIDRAVVLATGVAGVLVVKNRLSVRRDFGH
jgi:hyperosmotically inducible protein